MMKLQLIGLLLICQGAAFCPKDVRTTLRGHHFRLWGMADPLATEGEWSAYLDEENTGMIYYFNTQSGESMWEPPTESFPPVKIPDLKTRTAARAKQREYLAEKQEEGGVKKVGFLSSVLQTTKPDEEAKRAKEQKDEAPVAGKEEANWFDGLFEIKEQVESATKEKPKQEEPSKQEGTGFLSNLFGRKKEVRVNGVVNKKKTFGVLEETLKLETKVVTKQVIGVDASSVVLPHPQKVSWGGEDAVFVKGRTFGVFDGVSGAAKLDGIPLFSFTLASEMKRMIREEGASINEIINWMADASDFANRAATGASTAIVASIGTDGFLRVLNIGDSTCMVIRDNKVIARTKEIVHYFDCPYQLSEDSPDRAQDGTRLNFECLRGDIIVMGSDGLFDNLDEMSIVEIVSKAPDRSSVIARRIVDTARQVSLDDNAATPYAMLAKRNGFEDFQTGRGGKVDDVSCVVARCT